MGLLEHFYFKPKWTWSAFQVFMGLRGKSLGLAFFFFFCGQSSVEAGNKFSHIFMSGNRTSLMLHTIQVEWLKDKHVLKKNQLNPSSLYNYIAEIKSSVNPRCFPRACCPQKDFCIDCERSLGQLFSKQACQCQVLKLGGSSLPMSKNIKAERGPMPGDWEKSVHPHRQTSVGKESCFPSNV